MRECPDCGQETMVEVEASPHEFEYGRVPAQVIFVAVHGHFHCNHCGYEMADWRGEEARDLAVAAYLEKEKNK